MGFFHFVGKTVADVPSWTGIHQIKQQTNLIWGCIKPLFIVKKITHPRTFEQAMIDFNINEEDLKNIIKNYMYHFITYLIITFSLIIYTVYLFLNKHFIVGLIVILIATIFILKAFSAHFWCFQIKHRKLGCTLQEWFHGQIQDSHQ